jgi:ubiquinone/menaquinone biosynthesis C-methylase UbiE
MVVTAMKKRSRQAVRRYHDRVAGRYDDIYADAYWAWHNTLTWDYLKPYLPADLSHPVVDLGCGTGRWGLRLLKSGFAVTFVDLSPSMLDQARRKVSAMGMDEKARFVQADLEDLRSLEADRFALAVALGEPLGSTRRPAGALKQVRRLLRAGGRLVATFDNRLAGIEHYLREGTADGLAEFLSSGRTHWLTRDRTERFELHTYTPGQVRKLFSKAGFEVISLVGKTVLPMRAYRPMLEDPRVARRLLSIEKKLSRDPDAVGRAPHIQVAAQLACAPLSGRTGDPEGSS